MSDYEDLVERCHGFAYQATYEDIRIIIAEVLRTLKAHSLADGTVTFAAMLRDSPLTPQRNPQ